MTLPPDLPPGALPPGPPLEALPPGPVIGSRSLARHSSPSLGPMLPQLQTILPTPLMITCLRDGLVKPLPTDDDLSLFSASAARRVGPPTKRCEEHVVDT